MTRPARRDAAGEAGSTFEVKVEAGALELRATREEE